MLHLLSWEFRLYHYTSIAFQVLSLPVQCIPLIKYRINFCADLSEILTEVNANLNSYIQSMKANFKLTLHTSP